MFLPPVQAQAAETSLRSRSYEAANQLLHLHVARELQRSSDRSPALHSSSFATCPERRRTSTSGIVAA